MFFVNKEKIYKIWAKLSGKEKFDKIEAKFSNLKNEILNLKKEIKYLKQLQSTSDKKIQNLQTYFLDELIKKRLNKEICNYDKFIKDLFANQIVSLASWQNDYKEILKYYNILFENCSYKQDDSNNSTTNVFWGSQFILDDNEKLLFDCLVRDKNYVFAEMGFLHRIAYPTQKSKYSQGISFMFDDIAPYYDARFQNRLENMLNDKTLIINEKQIQRARACIDKIVKTHLTKYNHQPIFEPKIGKDGVEKVLVIDQVYGDMSIVKGFTNDSTFCQMLDAAVRENPNADIIVKTHPDTIDGTKGYLSGLVPLDNVYTLTEPINPISLIKYVDKVYVCTTQLGFEALMCNKEVHTFGMPFYAGWGLTIDRQKNKRRTNTRTLEEFFYIAYIMYTYYVNPDKNCRCEIEEAIDYLLKLRDEYFSEEVKE